MKLSIIITTCNDNEQCRETIKSIRATAGNEPEIIIVDDCSATPMSAGYIDPEFNVTLVTNPYRCGCGPSRHIGALHATGDWLLIIDSHMRFTPDWVKNANNSIAQCERNCILCATCLALDSDHMDPLSPAGEYNGATMNIYGPDRQKPDKMQIFEAVWLPRTAKPENMQPIPAIMGAAYFISREWFFTLSATRYLRSWGCDEQMLSIKSWLAGGEVRMASNVRIGHKFLLKNERQGFRPPPGHVLWNKMFAIATLCPPELAAALHLLIPTTLAPGEGRDMEEASQMFRRDYHIVAEEIAYNRALFKYDIRWYCERFGIPLP